MKLNPNYILRSIAGEHVIVPTGEASQQINGLITMNDTALTIWKGLETGRNQEQILTDLLNEFEVEPSDAKRDVKGFLNMLTERGILLDVETP